MYDEENRPDGTRLINMPFQGFYHSIWDEGLNMHLDTDAEYLAEQYGLDHIDVADQLMDCIDWGTTQLNIARAYVAIFFDRVWTAQLGTEPREIEAPEFYVMDSPKFYNFETDRIHAWIKESEIDLMFEHVDPESLDRVARERHTSYDGFMSFYDPDVDTWPADPKDWDHNQLQTLLLAYMDTVGADPHEVEVDCYNEIPLNEYIYWEKDLPDFENMEKADAE